MGDPKRCRRKWEGPRHPWRKDVLLQELELVGKYGLRNKRELWIAKTILRKIRAHARKLLSLPSDLRQEQEKVLIRRLYLMGILPSQDAVLDDVLSLTVEDILKRRLQTIVYSKGMAKSVYHARQLITHGHIAIDGKRVTSPGHLVTRGEESKISFYQGSPYAKIGVKSK
ncbi:MAG: 30S ribosomal protein S4 [Thermofilum sp. ex4484_15]|nr:MAG: 30S ribosomal protein S4 [Thermofilum sp. ex4484_15]